MNLFFYFGILFFVISFISIKSYIIYSQKFNLIDASSDLNVHSGKIPTGGGIIFGIVFFLGLVSILIFKEYLNIDIELPKNFFVFVFSAVVFILISFYDDVKKIHPIFRLIVQIILIFFCTSLFYLDFLNIPLKPLMFLTIVFWVYTLNITNFIDGADGFLTTNSINFFLSLFIFYFFYNNSTFPFYICLIILPILFAFIIFNKPKAKIFMGDTGSIFIGFLIGFCSIETILNGRWDIIFSLLIYNYMDCTITLTKKVLKKNYPWARMFDYFFLLPIKKNRDHNKVFFPNTIYNFSIFLIVMMQIFFNYKFLFLLSFVFSGILLIYYNSKKGQK